MKNAVEQIRKAVTEEADAEAAVILRDAREQLDRLARESREEEQRLADARLREDEAALEREFLREVSRARREMSLANLNARNRIIEDIFSRVREEALALPAKQYREVLGRWLREIDPAEAGEILPAARDAETLEGLIQEANATRNDDSRLTLSRENAPLISGFVFRASHYEVTKSLEGWLEEEKHAMSPQFEKELTPEVNNDRDG